MILFCILVALCVDSWLAPADAKCDDISTQACQLMSTNMPDLCQDVHTANVTCPRFCKMCPLTCYHCDIPLMDYHDCLTTKTCAKGEVCMLKELKSSTDGHDEYFMTCAPQQACDGTGLSFAFGKRNIQSRNVNAKCCTTDLCNTPLHKFSVTSTAKVPSTVSTPRKHMQTTHVPLTHSALFTHSTHNPVTSVPHTQTACRRDIVFIMDASMRYYHSLTGAGIRPFLASSFYASIRLGIELIQTVVRKLVIGPKENLVAMVSFDNLAHTHWDLGMYSQDKTTLLQLIANLRSNVSYKSHADVEQAVQFVLNNVLTFQHGDRPSYADDVVIITDTDSPFHNAILKQALQQKSHDIIVVYIQNGGASQGNVSTLATDTGHVIHVPSHGAMSSASTSLLKLLCS